MDRQDAERTITKYLKPVFGFALKRCRNIQDAEDLSQEIAMKVFRALLAKDDIEDADKFIWTAAHNALSNYYRDAAKSVIGVSLDEIAELAAAPEAWAGAEGGESVRRLQDEIAYLSGLQRKIVIAYYFENRRQADIARGLGIPLGTVKWHLFEAKKELKRGMNTMRKTGELRFNPIKFHSIGMNGKVGTKQPEDFFRSALPQNICYCVRNKAKTVNEVAEELGVSPVYVESEAEVLEEYGLLLRQKDRYLVNFIISEPTPELLIMQDKMFKRAAELFANALYDELTVSGILDDPGISCRQTKGADSMVRSPETDYNFLLWSLIPYIAARSGEEPADRISFEEAAAIRPDGGYNIVHACVVPDNMILPEDYVYMRRLSGPMWNAVEDGCMLWQVDSEWSDRPEPDTHYSERAGRFLSLYAKEGRERLSKDEYAWLAEQGYVKIQNGGGGDFKVLWQIVVLENREIQAELLAIGDRIKAEYRQEFEALKAPYRKAVLESVPAHLRKVKEYELQSLFRSEGWFLLHCIKALLKNGKLKEPAKEQRKALTTLIAYM